MANVCHAASTSNAGLFAELRQLDRFAGPLCIQCLIGGIRTMQLTESEPDAAAVPAVVRATSLNSIRVEPLTCAIGAELGNVDLGLAARTPEIMAEIRALLLRYRVL